MAVVNIVVEIAKELEYIRQRLGDMQKKAPIVMRTAINKTVREAKKQDERLAKQTYTAKKDINNLDFKKATTSNLEAVLKDRGANISMSHFKYYAGKTKLSVIINKQHGRKTLGKHGNPAFYNTLGKGGSGIAVRYGKPRLPIEKLVSISSPVMHGNNSVWGKIEPEVLSKLHSNVEKEIERILSK